MNKTILIIGSLNMDLSIPVKHMPQVGETILGKGLTYNPGGKGANQAYAAGRLGGEVRMLGCVGADQFGEVQKSGLAAAGVDVSGLRVSGTLPTGTAVIYVDEAGDNSIVVVAGANDECDIPYLEAHDALFQWCDYLLMQMEIPQDAILWAAKRAKELGKTVILNPAPAPDSISDELLSYIDYLTPNETELLKLADGEEGGKKGGENGGGKSEGDAAEKTSCSAMAGPTTLDTIKAGAAKLLKRGAGCLVVTMGEAGALLARAGQFEVYPARAVRAVDTTAAGDCFNGAFAVALAEGKSEGEAVLFANAASSVAVTRKGAQNSIPSREELEDIL